MNNISNPNFINLSLQSNSPLSPHNKSTAVNQNAIQSSATGGQSPNNGGQSP
jgi:hypothetical protein